VFRKNKHTAHILGGIKTSTQREIHVASRSPWL